jgi:hypothetical protein
MCGYLKWVINRLALKKIVGLIIEGKVLWKTCVYEWKVTEVKDKQDRLTWEKIKFRVIKIKITINKT